MSLIQFSITKDDDALSIMSKVNIALREHNFTFVVDEKHKQSMLAGVFDGLADYTLVEVENG